MSQIYPTVTCSRCNAKFNENNMNMLTRYEEWKKYEKEMLSKKLRDRFSNKDEEFIKKKISELPECFICKSCTNDFYLEKISYEQKFVNEEREKAEENGFLFASIIVSLAFIVDSTLNGYITYVVDGILTLVFSLIFNVIATQLAYGLGHSIDKSKIKGELDMKPYDRIRHFRNILHPFRSSYRYILPIIFLIISFKYSLYLWRIY